MLKSTDEKMHVLLLNTQMAAGGAQKAMLLLARGLKEAGHTVTLVTMYDTDDYVTIFEAEYGLEIIDLRLKQEGNTSLNPFVTSIGILHGLYRLYRLMRDIRPDLLQTFTHYSNIIGPFIAWLAGVPVRVSSQRSLLADRPRWLLTLDRLVANSFLVHKMTAVSNQTKQFCCIEQGIHPSKLLTIYNGIDNEKYQMDLLPEQQQTLRSAVNLTNEDTIILTVARLSIEKGHRYLLESVPLIHQLVPNAHFLLVGEGQLEAELRQEVKAHGLESHVHFLGMRQDIPELLAMSQLFILPSLSEGLPNVLLEAMSADVPVVATDLGSCREIITNGQDGLLVPPGDTEMLAQAAITLLQDRKLASTLAQAGRKRVVDNFSVSKSVEAYISLYEQLLHGKSDESSFDSLAGF